MEDLVEDIKMDMLLEVITLKLKLFLATISRTMLDLAVKNRTRFSWRMYDDFDFEN
jgi:hypothetical protein